MVREISGFSLANFSVMRAAEQEDLQGIESHVALVGRLVKPHG